MNASRIIALTGAVALALTTSAGVADAQRRIARGAALDATGAFRIHALSGSITIIGWDRDSVDVRGTVPTGANPLGGGSRAGWKMSVYDGFDDPGASGPSNLVAYVPRRAQVWIKSTSATITARDLAGSVELNSIEGAIEVRGAPASLRIETMRGAVGVTGDPRWMRIRTGAGAVTFAGASDDAGIATITGDITLTGRTRRGRLESVNGDVRVTGPLPAGAILDADTHDGGITLAIDSPVSATFALFTVSGRLANLLAPGSAAPAGKRTHEFVIGGGAARVTLRTFSGPISIAGR